MTIGIHSSKLPPKPAGESQKGSRTSLPQPCAIESRHFLKMYVHVNIVHTRMYIQICMYVYIYIYLHVCIYIYIFTCMYMIELSSKSQLQPLTIAAVPPMKQPKHPGCFRRCSCTAQSFVLPSLPQWHRLDQQRSSCATSVSSHQKSRLPALVKGIILRLNPYPQTNSGSEKQFQSLASCFSMDLT